MTKSTMVEAQTSDIPGQDLPRNNPCAQCGTPIPKPDWIEPGEGRISYLWNCRACNYRFEAVAIFDKAALEHPPLAA